jgi:hypothetical protein
LTEEALDATTNFEGGHRKGEEVSPKGPFRFVAFVSLRNRTDRWLLFDSLALAGHFGNMPPEKPGRLVNESPLEVLEVDGIAWSDVSEQGVENEGNCEEPQVSQKLSCVQCLCPGHEY